MKKLQIKLLKCYNTLKKVFKKEGEVRKVKIIVGLGNPESKYKGTRHNIGFEVINKLAYDYNIDINKSKFKAHIGEGIIGNEKVILVKPQTYMNLSGQSVKEIINFYKLNLEDLLIIYDDITLPVGAIKIRKSGSAGGQNGMKNIINLLSTDKIQRIKVGIGQKPSHYNLADYVLSNFNKNELDDMVLGITSATDAILSFIEDGIDNCMNKHNKKR